MVEKAAGPPVSTETATGAAMKSRTINRLKNFRSVATRYDKRAYVFHSTVTAAAIRLWFRQWSAGQNPGAAMSG
ncbi:hypothetical protein KBZ10_11895 [Streptomyces sp. F63]|nr:hypothetical protein [Streptomyces sp. F63]